MPYNNTDGVQTPVYQVTSVLVGELKRQQAIGIYNGVWLGILFTIAIAVVLLSTPAQRRASIFWIQCLAFLTAFANGILITMIFVANLEEIWTPKQELIPLLIRIESAQKATNLFTPLISDSTLIFKVLAFYPATLQPNRYKRLIPIAPLIILGLARLALCIVIIIYYYWTDLDEDEELWRTSTWVLTKGPIAEFSMQIAFCSYATAILFRKIYIFSRQRRPSTSQSPALARKLRYLIESLAMTFFLPVVAQIICLIAAAVGDTRILFDASLTNVYLSTLFSVLATSWSTIRLTRMQQIRISILQSGSGGSSGQESGEGREAMAVEKAVITPGKLLSTRDRQGYIANPEAARQGLLSMKGRRPESSPSTNADDVGNAHRNTILANLFNDGLDDQLIGQTTQIEVLNSFQQTHSGAVDTHVRLPTRDTSYWRRGVMRPDR